MPNTSHFSIFEYWYDKVITKEGDVLNWNDKGDRTDYHLVMVDTGEPCCWGCGKYAVKDDELESFDNDPAVTKDNYFKKLYSLPTLKSRLNRCHIVPKALGGADSPENLFLMCEDCHALSPDTVNRAAFFRWVYDRNQRYISGRMSGQEVIRRINEELNRRGFPDLVGCITKLGAGDKVKGVSSSVMFDDMNEWLDSRINTHANAYSETTLICGCVDWIIHTLNKLVLQ